MKTAMSLLWPSNWSVTSVLRLLRINSFGSSEKFTWFVGAALTLTVVTVSLITYKSEFLLDYIDSLPDFTTLSDVKNSNQVIASKKDNSYISDLSNVDSSNFEFHKEHIPYPETYSFKYTSLGFGMRDLKFIQEIPKDESEQRVLNMIPKRFRKKARIYIKPVMIISEKYQVDPLWVISVMWTESHFKPSARSNVGAQGLMQIMPRTRKYLLAKARAKGKNLEVHRKDFNINEYFESEANFKKDILVKKLINIELGVLYLKNLLKQFNYNHRHATVAYNMGPGWTLKRLRNNMPVGVKNEYWDKVSSAYETMATSL